MSLLLLGAGTSGAAWIPSKATVAIYQWLYDGADTPVEQTSAITGSPMTVANSRAGTGDRRELRQGVRCQTDGAADDGTIAYDASLAALFAGGSQAFTVAWDFKFTQALAPGVYIPWIANRATTSPYKGVFIGTNPDEGVQWGVGSNTGSFGCNSGATTGLNDGAWHTAVARYTGSGDAAGCSLWIDGVDVTTGASYTLTGDPTSTLDWRICKDVQRLNSGIKNIAMWSDALTDDEIAALTSPAGYIAPDNNELLLWCEAEAGTIDLDASGNGRNCTWSGTIGDIRQADTGVTYSAANELGHTVADGSTMYAEVGLSTLLTAGTIIPRDESNPTKCCAYDSGGQVDLQYTGQAPYYGKIIQSGALQGDGVADHVVLPQSLTDAMKGLSNASLVMWCDRLASGGDCHFGFWVNNSDRFELMLLFNGIVYGVVSTSGTAHSQVADNTTGKTCWVLAFDGSGATNADKTKLYKNGVQQSLTFSAAQPSVTTSHASLAGYIMLNSQGQFDDGVVFGCAAYSDTLSAAEALAIYESGTYPTDNLEALYPCSNITDTGIVPDVSGNGRHGVISGTIADVRAGRQDVVAWNQLHGFDVGVQFSGAATADYATATGVTPAAKGKFRFKGIASNIGTAQNLFGSGEAAGNFFTCYVDASGNIQVSLGSSANVLTSTTTYANGDYVDVAVLWDDADGSCSLRIDDVQEDSATYTGDLASNTKAIDIGNNNANGTHGEPWNGITISGVMYDTDQTTEIHNWTLDLSDSTVLTDSVGGSDATLTGTWVEAILPGLNGTGIDGSTAVTYGPGGTSDALLKDGSQLDRSGGVVTPLAVNVNAIDTSYQVGDGQINPEFVRETTTQADRFLAYSETLTGSNLTNAAEYTSLTPFDPTVYGTATHWWNQDSGIYSDAGSTPVVDNDPVYQWNDAIGSAHVIQATEANRPLYLSSSAGVDFDGSNDVLSYTSNIGNVGAVAIVLTLDSNGTGLDTVFELFTSQSASLRLASATTFNDSNAADFSKYITAADEGDIFINTVEGVTFTQNQKFVVTLSRKNSAIGSSRIDIGSSISLPTRSLSGQVHEMVVWSNLVSDADLRRAATALMAKHNII